MRANIVREKVIFIEQKKEKYFEQCPTFELY